MSCHHSLLKTRKINCVTVIPVPPPEFKLSDNSSFILTIAWREFKCNIQQAEEKVDVSKLNYFLSIVYHGFCWNTMSKIPVIQT